MAAVTGPSLESAPPPPTEPTANRRPCPYCGVWNSLEFAYCQRCGRALPPLENLAAPAPPAPAVPQPARPLPPPPTAVPSAWAVPPPPPAATPAVPEVEDTPAFDRPLSESESALLRKALQSQRVRLPRFLAFLVGIMPLAMIAMAAAGSAFISLNYTVIVLVTSVLGFLFGAVTQGIRTPIVKALSRGVAREVWGVPQVRQTTGTVRTVALGGIEFRMRNGLAARLLQDRMNRIVYVDGSPGKGRRGPSGWLPALVLDWNGQPAARPDMCAVSEATGRIPETPGMPSSPALGAFR
ncbi:MAG TPA: zinc ribbon domain-containing protein [Thermoplasmata archaeon]|nr:zinc ribbon domain-containing protein [Thermoplasmata archaeon]